MKGSIEFYVAIDFMKRQVSKPFSKHTPKASAIAQAAALCYPSEGGGHFPIRVSHIIEASNLLGLHVKLLSDGDALIGIGAEMFAKIKKARAVFDEDMICRHSFVPITFDLGSQNSKPRKKGCCKLCRNGRESPSEVEIQQARKWLKGMMLKDAPLGGAVILAARQLGHGVTKNVDGRFHFERSKPVQLPTSHQAVRP